MLPHPQLPPTPGKGQTLPEVKKEYFILHEQLLLCD